MRTCMCFSISCQNKWWIMWMCFHLDSLQRKTSKLSACVSQKHGNAPVYPHEFMNLSNIRYFATVKVFCFSSSKLSCKWCVNFFNSVAVRLLLSPPKIPRGRMFCKQMVDFVAISANLFAFVSWTSSHVIYLVIYRYNFNMSQASYHPL